MVLGSYLEKKIINWVKFCNCQKDDCIFESVSGAVLHIMCPSGNSRLCLPASSSASLLIGLQVLLHPANRLSPIASTTFFVNEPHQKAQVNLLKPLYLSRCNFVVFATPL